MHIHFKSMNKNIYVQPKLEILPLCMMQAICTSGEELGGLGGGDNGGNPWTGGRAPHNTVVF